MSEAGEEAADRPPGRSSVVAALLISTVLALGGHALFGDVGLNLADEGFLWYGVERTLEGELALRDFQSYEPGRYWWTATWCRVLGSGILDVRLAVTLFGAIGLFFGVRVLQRLGGGLALTCLGALALWAWMFPRHKLFETALSMTAVWFAVRLLERPTVRRHLAAGLFVGVAGLLGRNHILYCSLGFFLVVVLSSLRYGGLALRRGFPAWAVGVLVGFSPFLALLAFDAGMREAFVDSVLFFSKEHGSNLPLPYPWPWRLGHEHLPQGERIALGAAFLLPVVVYATGLVVALATRAEKLAQRRVLIAATLIGLFYAHHASVRSDPNHLAQSIHPALLGFAALPVALGGRRLASALAAVLLVAVSALAVPAVNPPVAGLRLLGARPNLVAFDARGDTLRLRRSEAEYLRGLVRVCGQVPADESLFIVPGLATLYPLCGRRSPEWGIYFLWPAAEERQRDIVRVLHERPVVWVLVVETPVDGNPELLFSRTHELVWRELQQHYARVATPSLPPNHALLRRR